MVDATIGVLSASALARTLERGDGGLDGWRLLVVSTAEDPGIDRPRVEEETRRRRGQAPVVFVDLASVEGIDVIASWLQRELVLEPWRGRGERVRPSTTS